MRLTFTIEIDAQREEGANVRKQDVAAAIMDSLFHQYDERETFAVARDDDHAWMRAESIVIFPHDDSRPPEDYPALEEPVRPGEPCPTCGITQFARVAASPGT